MASEIASDTVWAVSAEDQSRSEADVLAVRRIVFVDMVASASTAACALRRIAYAGVDVMDVAEKAGRTTVYLGVFFFLSLTRGHEATYFRH